MKYRIEYSPETEEQFQYLSKRQQVLVLDTVEKQLQFQPDIETKNRKPMRPNPLAPGNYVLVVYVSIMILKTALSELFLSVLLESKKGIMLELEKR